MHDTFDQRVHYFFVNGALLFTCVLIPESHVETAQAEVDVV